MDKSLDKVADFWLNKPPECKYTCPNVSLFRLLGAVLGPLDDKRIIEIGIGHGADLLECKRRGADVFGTDINPLSIKNIEKHIKNRVKFSHAGKQSFPFDGKFDVIYSLDAICYLTDNEIKFFLKEAFNRIRESGIIIIQIIEKDIKVKNQDPLLDINFQALSDHLDTTIHKRINPIRFLSNKEFINMAEEIGLKLIATKRLMQSFDLNEEYYRLERYFVYTK